MERPAPGSLLLCGVSKRLRMRLGRVEVTGGFLLLTAWLNYLDRQGVVPLALLACALHELGHWAALRALGARVRRVRLTAVGAEMEVDRTLSYGGELLAALAGPGANLALALAFSPLTGGGLFAGLNLALACFNLLPVGQMDGGRVLRCVLAWLMGPARPTGSGASGPVSLRTASLGAFGMLWRDCHIISDLLLVIFCAVSGKGRKKGLSYSAETGKIEFTYAERTGGAT